MTLHLKELEKEEQIKPKVSRRQKIINQFEKKLKAIGEKKNNDTKSSFLKDKQNWENFSQTHPGKKKERPKYIKS